MAFRCGLQSMRHRRLRSSEWATTRPEGVLARCNGHWSRLLNTGPESYLRRVDGVYTAPLGMSRMDLPRISRIGLLFLFLGALLFAGWVLWVKTRITRPVDMPVSMSPGHFRSREFNINLEAVYLIEIAADKNKIPADTLRCLLGYKILDSDCAETPSVVKASWVLSSGGHVMAHGTTDDPGGGAVTNNEIARAIGAFDGEEGCRYVLDVDILGDGSKLAPGNPRLRVELFPYPAGKMAWGPAILLATVF
ncbi:MAG: hypothetical protein JWN45_3282, partial [Acidobacteriaceae bacterium]|nr:hypothetical protein [Acidobacteriaceae bacterium]